MIFAGIAVLVLAAFAAGVAVGLLYVRAEHDTTREHVTLAVVALGAQLRGEREEHRKHLDAAGAVIVAQLAAQLRPPVRLVPRVGVQLVPPLSVPEEKTLPAGSRPWPGGDAA